MAELGARFQGSPGWFLVTHSIPPLFGRKINFFPWQGCTILWAWFKNHEPSHPLLPGPLSLSRTSAAALSCLISLWSQWHSLYSSKQQAFLASTFAFRRSTSCTNCFSTALLLFLGSWSMRYIVLTVGGLLDAWGIVASRQLGSPWVLKNSHENRGNPCLTQGGSNLWMVIDYLKQ